jgi:hypothetical protein
MQMEWIGGFPINLCSAVLFSILVEMEPTFSLWKLNVKKKLGK